MTGQLRPVERCANCWGGFVCGYAAGLGHCWCTAQPLPAARLIVPTRHCLCPACLARRQGAADK
nr:cysteine-rich CWC family protein [Cupriavidus sp. AU9028]